MKMCIPLCQTYKPTVIWNRFPKVEQYTEGKWMVHGTKHPKDNQLQSSVGQMAERSPLFKDQKTQTILTIYEKQTRASIAYTPCDIQVLYLIGMF